MGFDRAITVKQCQAVDITDIPVLSIADFRKCVTRNVKSGGRISALFGADNGASSLRLYAVISHPELETIALAATEVGDTYPSLTPECPQAHWFEREIAKQWGVVPKGHPWLKPIRYHHSYRENTDAWGRSSDTDILPSVRDFFSVEGEEVHEVAVGPVHAGIIEPGHFRFQCHGERVLNLEISLGYQHRGVERALTGGPDKRTLHLMETLAGDTTAGHSLAYCNVVESLSGCEVHPKAHLVRAVALELERMANHVGDLGALAGDIGFLPTLAFCGRLRGDYLNMTGLMCGNRFSRGLIKPGGVGYDVDTSLAGEMLARLGKARTDTEGALKVLFETPSVLARFENTGTLSAGICLSLGIVGVAARASGLSCDVRSNFPHGHYRRKAIPISTEEAGDVLARAMVRWLEVQASVEYLENELKHISDESVEPAGSSTLKPNSMTVSLVEGWRGEICHVAITSAEGRFNIYKVVDPSFHNWSGLAMALRDQQISDFPLCNKSFDLSYCGHDL